MKNTFDGAYTTELNNFIPKECIHIMHFSLILPLDRTPKYCEKPVEIWQINENFAFDYLNYVKNTPSLP